MAGCLASGRARARTGSACSSTIPGRCLASAAARRRARAAETPALPFSPRDKVTRLTRRCAAAMDTAVRKSQTDIKKCSAAVLLAAVVASSQPFPRAGRPRDSRQDAGATASLVLFAAVVHLGGTGCVHHACLLGAGFGGDHRLRSPVVWCDRDYLLGRVAQVRQEAIDHGLGI
jgi:hypothetical protein